jgi:hypothetical protein
MGRSTYRLVFAPNLWFTGRGSGQGEENSRDKAPEKTDRTCNAQAAQGGISGQAERPKPTDGC